MTLEQQLEAVLFAAAEPVAATTLAGIAPDIDEERVEQAISALRERYDRIGSALTVVDVSGGYQLLTRPEYAAVLARIDTVPAPATLSAPALETLAIIAYSQPVGRAAIEEIRGVAVDGVLRTLQERELIEVVGRSEALGRPLLYGTTPKFLRHFGFRSLADLPPSGAPPAEVPTPTSEVR